MITKISQNLNYSRHYRFNEGYMSQGMDKDIMEISYDLRIPPYIVDEIIYRLNEKYHFNVPKEVNESQKKNNESLSKLSELVDKIELNPKKLSQESTTQVTSTQVTSTQVTSKMKP